MTTIKKIGKLPDEVRMSHPYRQKAVISSISPTTDSEHGIFTLYVYLDLESGGIQGFGGWHLGSMRTQDDRLVKDLCGRLCKLFNVDHIDQLVGKECYVLYNWPTYNSVIEGLENAVTGERFTTSTWCKDRSAQGAFQSNLERKRFNIERDIANMIQRLQKLETEWETLDDVYADWEEP